MHKTKENLKQALGGEAQAYLRYRGFAVQADEEGFPGVAKLFRAAAKAEMVHAQSHQCALGDAKEIIENLKSEDEVQKTLANLKSDGTIQGTMENLKSALEGETHEFKQMYPAMVQDAVEEKATEARYSMEYAMSAEMVHAKLFKQALENPDAKLEAAYYVCPVCGHTVFEKAPKKCPYCGVDAKKFMEVH
ncbi:MAG: rubrerythrin family protein [Desulfobacterales bacterium]|nr:MAG: rubrerythrin family protein [Desulfobacterales bacterium]